MVRLLQPPDPRIIYPALVFQSHNGAIAARVSLISLNALITFNPTMVRLLRSISISKKANVISFQSHNGAIAARHDVAEVITAPDAFQSHNGAIAACSGFSTPGSSGSSFNPTMVRLLHALKTQRNYRDP